mgnify:CR=1 FL=1
MRTTKERDGRRDNLAAQEYQKKVADGRPRRSRAFVFTSIVVGVMMIWGDGNVAVAESSVAARDVVTRGAIELGGAVGYAQATTAVGAGTSANRAAVFVLPRIGIVLTDPLGSGWYQGNVELLVEPVYARFTKPFAADGAGGSFVVKYNFLSFGRWMPFWDAGAGIFWTNLAPRISEQSTQFEFGLETGPGAQYFVTDRISWTMGVRLHHISNANLGERNTGINGVLPYVGISFFTPQLF